MGRLQDKVVVVTASTRGIGAAIAEKCAKEGAITYLAVRRLDAGAEQAAALNAQGCCVKTVYMDATKQETFSSMIEEVIAAEGRIDGLVNNFGGTKPKNDKDFLHTDFETFADYVKVHLASVFIPSQIAAKSMAKTGGGSIVNISSVAGSHPDVSQIAYGTSKAAINYLTKLIATHCARAGVRCNSVAPGMTATEAVSGNLSPEFMEFFLRHTPIRRMGEPEDIANAVVFFLSDESAFITGNHVEVSGGFGMCTPVFADTYEGASR